MKTLHCSDLTKEIDSLLSDGYRLDMIMPADDPREAVVSKGEDRIRLSANPQSKGRAGMEYRDLIPDRLGGRVVASHIRITEGGAVPDYVHYHKIQYQMIYCKSGSIRVVYEDQGPPFVLEPGDCVLQPPQIRHRVLESSAGAEVIEVSSPAEHETWVEHEIELPTAEIKPDRDFGGQRFVRHVAAEAQWIGETNGVTARDTGIGSATNGLTNARVIRIKKDCTHRLEGETVFLFVLDGTIALELASGESVNLSADQSFVISESTAALNSTTNAEILLVTVPKF